MILSLSRFQKQREGIASLLEDASGKTVSVTLEHAYPDGSGGWEPKIPNGTFTCVRGKHRLDSMPVGEFFETFMITGVPGHTNLLFHWGNWEKDSDGCVLTGAALTESPGGLMVTNSKATFKKIMGLLEGVDQFTLTVS